MKTALISGARGQFASHMADLLISKNYLVVSFERKSGSERDYSNIKHLLGNPNFILETGDLNDFSSLVRLLKTHKPDEIYNFAALSHVHQSFDQPIVTCDVNFQGVANFLEAVRLVSPNSKFYHSSTSVSGDTKVIVKINDEIVVDYISNIVLKDMHYFNNLECLTVTDEYKVKWSKVKYGFRHPSNDLYHIRGSGGLELTLTGSHSVITLDEDGSLVSKTTDELTEDDHLLSFTSNNISPTSYPSFDLSKYPIRKTRRSHTFNEIRIDENLMRLFGYYLSEGSIYLGKRNGSITFTCNISDTNSINDIADIVKTYFNIDCSIRTRTNTNSVQIIVYSKILSQFVVDHFGKLARGKKIPSWFFNIPRNGIVEFFKGYMCDAKITLPHSIVFTSVNKDMIESMGYLAKLNNIDIKLVHRQNQDRVLPQGTFIEGSCCYDMCLSGKNTDDFLGVPHDRRLHLKTNSELIPIKVVDSHFDKSHHKVSMSKEKVLRLLEQRISKNLYIKDVNKLEKLCKSSLHIVRIKSVERVSGEQMVYDFHVPETQRFIGGNYPVLLHNSEVYGDVQVPQQNENTEVRPRSPYGASKVGAEALIKVYKDSYDIFAFFTRNFNSEGTHRGKTFVTRKITNWIGESVSHCLNGKSLFSAMPSLALTMKSALESGHIKPLALGNLDAKRDWTDCRDTVRGIYLAMQNKTPDDYVLGSGKTRSIREFLDAAFSCIHIYDWSDFVTIDPKFYRPAEVNLLCSDASKAKVQLGWEPCIPFDVMVSDMVFNDIELHSPSIKVSTT